MAGTFPQVGAEAVLKGTNKFLSDTKKVGKGIGSIGKTAKSVSKGIGTLTKGFATTATAVAAAGIAMKKAFDLARQGAVIEQTAESFGFLLAKVDAAPDLLDQLTAAAKGTVNEFQLMSSVATLLAGTQGELATAMADATPRLLEIAKAANKLNPTLGDTTFLFESLAKGIKRSSFLILDNLGLTIRVGEANRKYAESIGKSVTELSAQERQLALLNEVLGQGDVLIGQVGGTTDSATDSFDRLTTAIINDKNAILAWLGEALSPAADALFIILEGQNLINEAVEKAAQDAVITTKSYEEYGKRMEEIGNIAGATALTHDELSDAIGGLREGEKIANTIIKLSEAEFKAAKNAQVFEQSLENLGIDIETIGDDLTGIREPLEGIANIGTVAAQQLSSLGLSATEVDAAIADLGLSTDAATFSQEQLIQETNLLIEAWSLGVISADRLTEGLAQAEDGTLRLGATQRAELQASIAQAQALREAAAAAREAALAQSELAQQLKDATAAQVAQAAISRLSELAKAASDEDFPKFLQAIQETQEAFGLTDPESVALAESIGIVTAALVEGVLPAEDFDEALSAIIEDAKDGVVDFDALADTFFTTLPESIAETASAFGTGEADFSESLSEMQKNAEIAATSIVTAFEEPNWAGLGMDIAQGIAQGITAGTSAIEAAAAAAARAALEAAEAELDTGSPSREFEKIGQQAMAGMASGITSAVGAVEASVTGASAATVSAGETAARGAGGRGDTNIDRSFNPTVNATYGDVQSPATVADDLVGIAGFIR